MKRWRWIRRKAGAEFKTGTVDASSWFAARAEVMRANAFVEPGEIEIEHLEDIVPSPSADAPRMAARASVLATLKTNGRHHAPAGALNGKGRHP